MQPQARIAATQIRISALGRDWLLDHSQNLEDLWNAMSDADFADERIPYWAELWPASLALAEWLGQADIAGKLCLDIGCGLGFTAMIGQQLGAKVLAFDYSLAALKTAQLNCRLNSCPSPQFLAMDWRKPALIQGSIAYAWAGDILYEERAMRPVLNLLEYALAQNGIAWIAEPGRSIFRKFQHLATETGWNLQKVFTLLTPAVQDQEQKITATVWQLSGKATVSGLSSKKCQL